MSKGHVHDWQLIRTFIGEGKPKIMQRLVPSTTTASTPKVQMWLDSRQEYALMVCGCGEKKEVRV